MEAQTECSTTEIKQLRRCINDLISVLALPAMWSGGEPAQIVRTLLDVLLDMLNLDMVYVRIEDQAGNAPLEIVRAAQSQSLAVGPQEMGELLNRSLGDEPQKWPPFLRNRIGDADLSLVPLRLGLQGELGVIVAGSQRPGFPGQTERLLLSVAANQALIGLQGGRLLSEQKRVATELDQRVAQRTSELAAANEELKMEIAERKLAEEAFNRIQSELTHVSRVTTLGELTASIAHEVNQPLGSVINNANACLNLLSNDPPQLNEVRDALEEIIQGTDQASAVILRVKQMVRKAPSDRTVLRLRDVVADVLSLARHDTASRRVTIRLELTEDMPQVKGDRVQLQQVLLNLFVNGMDAMSATGESKRILTIWGRHDTRDGESRCLLGVQDAGIGLKPDEMDQLFEAFYTTKPQGMGMGLAISRSIIEAHGGRLWAEANQESGATFLFSLPEARSFNS